MVDEGEKGRKMKKWIKVNHIPGWIATLGMEMWLLGGIAALWVSPEMSRDIQIVGDMIMAASLALAVLSELPDYPNE